MRTYRRHAGGAAEHRHRAARRQTFSLSAVILKPRQQAWGTLMVAVQNLLNKRILGGFTSFCKNEGTDLLIFFKWFESENEDEEGEGVAETVVCERQDVRNSTNFTACL